MSLTPSNVFALNPFEPIQQGSEAGPPRSMIAFGQLLRKQDLSVVFQPIVRLATGKVFAYEALTRCSVPEYKNPEALFNRAVMDGCCGRLGRTVREVAIPLCEWVPLFVNVHPRELEEKWLVQPDDPVFLHDSTVYIEITEAVPLTHFQLCKHVLSEVRRRADARLVIDDLGAGFSNVRLIADLEPSIVKLDRSLIMDLHKHPRKQLLVRGLVNMCVSLGAQVVAEGIELAEELQAVRDTGAHYGQGYLFARPAFPLPLREQIEE